MLVLGWTFVAIALGVGAYTYVGYPVLLALMARLRRARHEPAPGERDTWPSVSVSVPVYNEVHQVDSLLESLLAIDYPRDRLQLLVVSDASDDGTDDRVRAYADRGIELVRAERRRGKTAVEWLAASRIHGDVVVNTDASIRLHPDAVRHLVARLAADPRIGVASGRDISVARMGADANAGESGYVGYEMTIRRLETSVHGIVGASGCLYAIRTPLHRTPLPEHLSRDFASALIARQAGYRAISVDEALCYVPRAASLKKEYRRKVRTICRGMETLWHFRELLDPRRHGLFAWMLLSHKVARWSAPWAAALGLVGIALLAPSRLWAAVILSASLVVLAAAIVGWLVPARRLPRLLSIPAFLLAGNLAAMHALVSALRGRRDPFWEPTRREEAVA